MATYRLYCLGRPFLELGGKPVKLETRKSLALLIYLRMADHDYSRESLATLFWPEYDQQHASADLRRVLSSLNRSLQGECLEADRDKIGLKDRSKIWLDVESFQGLGTASKTHTHANDQACPACLRSLEEAVQLYRGDFLEGFNLRDCPEFDEWQTMLRERFRRELANVLETLSRGYGAQSQWELAITHARHWIALDSLSEPAQRMLIGLYNQSSQRNAALQQYEVFSRELDEQLGGTPEPETTRLIQQVSSAETTPSPGTSRPVPFPSAAPLLKTKLYIPSARSRRVTRNRLLELMKESARQEFTLISAPAGYGKTTLLAEWAMVTELPVAWVSVDEGDNDPNRFFTYICEAINGVYPGSGDHALEILRSSIPLPLPTLLPILLNDVCEITEPFALVLDDYHIITAQPVHDAVTFMLDHLPPMMHLVIATRTDPPFSLARLRSRQQLEEIRASHLRFNPDEASEFLNRTMELNLKEEDILSLESRTEGWIAGLQMAALSMQGRQDLSQFIQYFTGSHRYIMDYLVDEVLLRQPEDIQKFLLNTSILKRLSGPLCDALLEQRESQSILEKLEKANLFLVSLDDDRKWYRFHHLFADLLHARLKQQAPDIIPELHIRCSEWYEANQFMDEAVDHALSARDYDRASRLVDQLSGPMLARSGGYILQGWIDQLPAEIALSRPWLCISQAWARLTLGLIDQVESLLQAAERKISPEDPPYNRQEWLGHIACIRACRDDFYGDVPGTIRMAEQALEDLPIEDIATREKVAFILGHAYCTQGEFFRGISVLSESIRQCIEADTAHMIGPCLGVLSKIYRLQGRLHDVIKHTQETRQYIESRDARRFYLAGNAYISPASVWYEWNDLEAAERIARYALDHTMNWGNPSATCAAYTILGRVFQAQGQLEAAGDVLHSAQEALRGRVSLSDVMGELNAARVKLWLATGELSKASQWAIDWEKNMDPNAAFSIAREQDEITLSQVLIAKGQYQEALRILSRLAESCEIGGRIYRLIEIFVHQASAFYAQKETPTALKVLEKCLVLAKPEGYVRVFLDEGKPMHDLLTLGKDQGGWNTGPLKGYVDQLLSAFVSA